MRLLLRYIVCIAFIMVSIKMNSQKNPSNLYDLSEEEIPFYELIEIEEQPEAGSIFARMIEGLGFRLYWATYGLTAQDFEYRITPESRSTGETLVHIADLTRTIYSSVTRKSGTDLPSHQDLDLSQKRTYSLVLLSEIAHILKNSTIEDIENYTIDFIRNGQTVSFSFWNLINGPIADAIWHTGQIASFRRASGNPFPSNISLLTGKVMR